MQIVHLEVKEELNRKEKARRQKARQARQKRSALQYSLEEVFARIE